MEMRCARSHKVRFLRWHHLLINVKEPLSSRLLYVYSPDFFSANNVQTMICPKRPTRPGIHIPNVDSCTIVTGRLQLSLYQLLPTQMNKSYRFRQQR